MKYSWILPVLVVAVLLGALGYWGYNQYQEREQMQVYLGNQYNESFYNLVDGVENCTGLLGKGIISTGQSQLVTVLSDTWQQANVAQEVLNQLPISNATLIKTSKFLSQLGDYCMTLAKANLKQRTISKDEKDKLISLRSQAANLSQALHNLESDVNQGKINWWQTVQKTRKTIDEKDKQLLSNNFKDMVESNEPFPTLIYDGPFSDHIDQEEPQGITGAMVDRKQARKIATNFPDYSNKANLIVKDLGEAKGKIPAYQFSIQPEGNNKNHTSIDITKKGGHVVMYLNPRNVDQGGISRVEALEKCDQFLKAKNYSGMVPTYSWIEDNILTASYAYKQDEVIMYPDLIKMKVAMDNGQIIGFEGLGYLMSHHDRKLPQPKITEEEVKGFVDEQYQIDSVRLAVIPSPSRREIFTWEARVGYQEETYLLYYDVQSGDEVNVLKVIDTPKGTFTE